MWEDEKWNLVLNLKEVISKYQPWLNWLMKKISKSYCRLNTTFADLFIFLIILVFLTSLINKCVNVFQIIRKKRQDFNFRLSGKNQWNINSHKNLTEQLKRYQVIMKELLYILAWFWVAAGKSFRYFIFIDSK